MSGSSIQFHKIWIDQCEATEGIRESFGLKNALDYLIGEKLFNFVQASEQHPEFAAELPAFVAEIQRIFAADEISEYLRHLEQTKFLAPPDVDLYVSPCYAIELPDEDADELDVRLPLTSFLRWVNLIGWAGLAIGNMQLVAPKDEVVLAAGLAWECGP